MCNRISIYTSCNKIVKAACEPDSLRMLQIGGKLLCTEWVVIRFNPAIDIFYTCSKILHFFITITLPLWNTCTSPVIMASFPLDAFLNLG